MWYKYSRHHWSSNVSQIHTSYNISFCITWEKQNKTYQKKMINFYMVTVVQMHRQY